jgi:hypothetical protein
VSDTEEFLQAVLPRLREESIALHNGDPGPRLALWSRNEPVTLFGALQIKSGWNDVGQVFEWLRRASRTAIRSKSRSSGQTRAATSATWSGSSTQRHRWMAHDHRPTSFGSQPSSDERTATGKPCIGTQIRCQRVRLQAIS